MGNIFRGRELVEIGIQIEKNGRDFYSSVAARTPDKAAAGLFRYLSGEEERHIDVFQGMLEKLNSYREPESYPGDYIAYMKDLAAEHLFTQPDRGEELAATIRSDREAIDFGIGIEKDSIIFYLGMKDVVPADDRDVLDKLITEEQKHLKKLIDMKKGTTL